MALSIRYLLVDLIKKTGAAEDADGSDCGAVVQQWKIRMVFVAQSGPGRRPSR